MGTESTSVVLSAAIVEWEADEDFTYDDLLNRAVFVKFNVVEQVTKYKRVIDKGTLDWWERQSSHAKKMSFIPSSSDISVEEGMTCLRNYVANSKSKNKVMWVRGSLDQMVIDSLSRAAGIPDLAPYWSYRDVRTAIELLYTKSRNGYCNVPGFNDSMVHKHDPIHDCAYDAMMLRYGEQ